MDGTIKRAYTKFSPGHAARFNLETTESQQFGIKKPARL